jgi:hypothetical protein
LNDFTNEIHPRSFLTSLLRHAKSHLPEWINELAQHSQHDAATRSKFLCLRMIVRRLKLSCIVSLGCMHAPPYAAFYDDFNSRRAIQKLAASRLRVEDIIERVRELLPFAETPRLKSDPVLPGRIFAFIPWYQTQAKPGEHDTRMQNAILTYCRDFSC